MCFRILRAVSKFNFILVLISVIQIWIPLTKESNVLSRHKPEGSGAKWWNSEAPLMEWLKDLKSFQGSDNQDEFHLSRGRSDDRRQNKLFSTTRYGDNNKQIESRWYKVRRPRSRHTYSRRGRPRPRWPIPSSVTYGSPYTYWPEPYKYKYSSPSYSPSYEYFKPFDTHVEDPVSEYYRNLASLPEFIKDYQSTYVETPPTTTSTISITPPSQHSQGENHENLYQDEEHDEYPPHDDHDDHFENQEHGDEHNSEEWGENEHLDHEPDVKPNPNPNGKVKYTGCQESGMSPESGNIQQPNEELNPPVLEIESPPIRTVHIEPIQDIPISSNTSSIEPIPTGVKDEDEFEKLYPHIFEEYHIPFLIMALNNSNSVNNPVRPNKTQSESSKTILAVKSSTFTTTTTETPYDVATTTTTTPTSTTTTSTSQPPLTQEEVKVPPNGTEDTTQAPSAIPVALDMSASISTDFHLDDSQDESFKKALLDELIHRLKMMESSTTRAAVGLPLIRRRSSQEYADEEMEEIRITNYSRSKEKRMKSIKSAIRKLLKNL